MNTSIRIVSSEEERRQLVALLAEYEESLPPGLRHWSVPVTEGTSSVAILATVDDAACGCVFVSRHDDAAAVIQRLYVRPAARGQGLARALMQHAADHARVHGYHRLVLDTDKDQLPAAYQLYLSLGFRLCGPYADVGYANPVYMELPLVSSVSIDPM
ncbi:MAG: GNAT family N-acetyltransferase [Candidatus Eremiobacteraeota bacterium]|nr:GNAT family N-acetyltransferase [Candidatus Eremiobacteraeota bacterium]